MSNSTVEVDVAVIGAGSAGLVARRQALTHGAKRVILIEGGAYGTTCARVGCMPSKLLVAAAEAAEAVRAAPGFGVEAGELRIDGAAVMARIQRERDRFVGFVVDASEKIDARDRLRGWARFVGPASLEVETEAGLVRVDAKTVVVATGSSPNVPPPLRGLGERLLTSDSIFDLATLPKSLIVVGLGVIGLELGQALTRLGVEVRILDIGAQLPLLRSAVMQAEALELFSERLDLQLEISDLAAERTPAGDGVRVSWTRADGEACEAVVEYVLAATGRRPQLARLELQRAGIELDERGVPQGWDQRTTQLGDAPVFLAGDVTGYRPVLHEAAAEGRIAGVNAARYPEVRAHVRHVAMGIVFSSPNIAVIGEIPGPEGQAVDWDVGEVDYGNQGRARVIGENHGRARIYADAQCGVLLGAELLGPAAEHLAHLLAWAVEQRLTVQRTLEMPYYHPVLEEGLRTALQQLGRKLKLGPEVRPLDCGPGT